MAADNPVWGAAKPFLTGSMAGMVATCVIQPVDMVKVRIQLAAGGGGGAASPGAVISSIMANEGIGGFYKGLSAALTRQILYTGARLGLFDKFTAMAKNPGEKMPFYKLSLCAMGAGGIGAAVGNPADLALVRMQADAVLPEAERRGYTSIVSAVQAIVKNEGAMGLMGGVAPTMYRAVAQNFGMLAFNAKTKEVLEGMEVGTDNMRVFGSAAVGGFAASVFALPFDYVKTQVQKMVPDPATGAMPYKGPLDCAMQQVKKGGPLVFYAGFPVFYVRMAPHAMISLIMQDNIKKLWKNMGL